LSARHSRRPNVKGELASVAWWLLVFGTIGFAGCGADDKKQADSTATKPAMTTTTPRVQGRDCASPSRAAVKALERSLRDGGELRAARALPSADTYQAPAELREGAVFIAAKLGDKASVLWLVDDQFVKTGQGVAVAASAGTRRLSSLGADLDPDEIGIAPSSRGLREVRECVNQRAKALEAKARRATTRVATTLTGSYTDPTGERGGHGVDVTVATHEHPNGDLSAGGTVTVRLSGDGEDQVMGSHRVQAGRARWTLPPGDPGPYGVVARYSGDAAHKPSSVCIHPGDDGNQCPSGSSQTQAESGTTSCGPFTVGEANSSAYPNRDLPARGSATGSRCTTLERIARRLHSNEYKLPDSAFVNAPEWGPQFSLSDEGSNWKCQFQSHGLSGPSYAVRCSNKTARLRWRAG
jgi:hypothetical protein